ncbi:type I site-specific deoxyribonuclease [Tolypothrix sp. NIES-4075]|nr:type I site-specific deoxyribonuclease [Tolypothrix sp. NIES-4075]
MPQSEAELEQKLIKRLTGLGYEPVTLRNAEDLKANLKTQLPKVDKVLFVVDRADLDYQTSKEFNHFSEGCVDTTDSTKQLVNQMAGDSRLIVGEAQK